MHVPIIVECMPDIAQFSRGTNYCSDCGGTCLEFACLNGPEEVAAEKGGIRQLLDEKWRQVYHANAPRGLFRRAEVQAA